MSGAVASRYQHTANSKANGVVHTPKLLARFVASAIVEAARHLLVPGLIRILDPAVGDGELALSLVEAIRTTSNADIELTAFDTDPEALARARARFVALSLKVTTRLFNQDFLAWEGVSSSAHGQRGLFASPPEQFDLIIANPPYVRTQIMGGDRARRLSEVFGLSGRADLYHAFLVGMSRVLSPRGVAGVIVSNRFLTTKAGAAVRELLRREFRTRHIWDLGDTRVFEAAVLPAVLLLEGRASDSCSPARFTSIYQTASPTHHVADDPVSALSSEGTVALPDGRRFLVQHGELDAGDEVHGVWRMATQAIERWLAKAQSHTWGDFRRIGRVRVGIKTCADRVFIRKDWGVMPTDATPELLRPLSTHHVAGCFRHTDIAEPYSVLYPHEAINGRSRPVDLSLYPRSRAYLLQHRAELERRTYIADAHRAWYEIWVPQDPGLWQQPKVILRDIAEKPRFWLDFSGSVVNGDCYWLTGQRPDDLQLLWLAAAVGNSSFGLTYYDYRFGNRLYAGRRRFITQYVERFPLPDPSLPAAKQIVRIAKRIFECGNPADAAEAACEVDQLVWRAFGLSAEQPVG